MEQQYGEDSYQQAGAEEEVEISVSYQTLDVLQEHGIAANDIQKLNDAGYHTVESIAHATVRKLSEVKEFLRQKLRSLKILSSRWFLWILRQRQTRWKIARVW